MNNIDLIRNWVSSAEENVKVAEDMYRLKHYHWSLFMWHLAIEKTIKAIYVKQDLEVPYIHDIGRLLKGLNIKIEDLGLSSADLNEITSFNMEARYEDYKHAIYKKSTKKYAEEWLKTCQKVYIWLKNKLD